MSSPFSPERYIQALNTCLASKVEVVIIDSLSMEWVDIPGQNGPPILVFFDR
jgi:hypothetical protein